MMSKSVDKYKRTFQELKTVASMFWPSELSEKEANLSIVPLLLKTQDQFINIISIKPRSLNALFKIVEASALSANMFLKHLVILADFSGESLKRVSNEFHNLFPNQVMPYYWYGKRKQYHFKALGTKNFSNKALKIDGKNLFQEQPLDDLQKDAIALLLFGSAYSVNNHKAASVLSKCEIGGYLGKPNELATFIKQRYIWVSRVTGGAQANNLGQLAQSFVAEYVSQNLNLQGIEIQPGGRLPNVTHTDTATGRDTSFDLVVTNGKMYVAIEVSFQVTTNSVIERKSGQAKARYDQIKKAGYKIAYVLDGAGNFERQSALQNICKYSDCTVAFSQGELDVLCEFLKEQFSQTK